MSQPQRHKGTVLAYTLVGGLSGLAFPAIAAVLVFALDVDRLTLLWIIATAPVVLALAGFLLGRREARRRVLDEELEQRVADRTNAVQSMLDVTGDGFLTFGPDFLVQPQYSQPCEQIFEGPISGQRIDTLLFENEEARSDFEDGLSLFFSGKAKAEVIFDLLEHKEGLEIGERTYELTFRAINDQTVMLAITDITDRKRLEVELEEQNRRRDLILRVVSNKMYFAAYLEEATVLFDRLDALAANKSGSIAEEIVVDLAARVHTFKGNANFLGFSRTATVAHDLEDQLNALALIDDIDLSSEVFVLKRQYYEEYNIIQETLGDQWMDDLSTISVPKRTILRVEEYARNHHADDPRLAAALEQLRTVRFSDLFSRFPQLLMDVASRRGRRLKPVEVVGGDFRVLPDRFEPLVNSLEHIARNMVDHGIEAPSQREMKGKDSRGEIRVELARTPDGYSIAMSDDGQGISFAAVEAQARESGLIAEGHSPSRAELLRLLFSSGLSTATEVSSVSGRGVGLNAVQRAVARLGGKITVETKPDRGTTFRIVVPGKAPMRGANEG
jgi:two-component system chemotaxis sensor kinase CheA